ncbi:MAG: arginine decarboxylase, pyruvoyl-dependent [Clostridia bacterium]|nr:arginine decarboxylase, pyruvoyl-dependent [Clostridia bacterium]
MLQYPKEYVMTSGSGVASQKLVAFDKALVDAGISNYNLLKVSSILPIGCERKSKVDKKQGSALLTAYATITSDEIGTTISTAVAVGIPERESDVGVIMEFSGKCSADEAVATVKQMVIEAMHNHNIPCATVDVTFAEGTVQGEGYLTLISALSMW